MVPDRFVCRSRMFQGAQVSSGQPGSCLMQSTFSASTFSASTFSVLTFYAFSVLVGKSDPAERRAGYAPGDGGESRVGGHTAARLIRKRLAGPRVYFPGTPLRGSGAASPAGV